jgi:hypothetical protein
MTGADNWNQWAQLCCACGLCTLYACPEDLFPKEACDQGKTSLAAAGIEFVQEKEVRVHPMKEHRRVPQKLLRKRLKVEFGEQAFDHKGILHDISIGGIFISAGRLFKKGTRLHLHVVDRESDFYAEGVVVRLKRVDQLLRRIEAQGMGIRLMSPAEVVREMIPKVARAVDTQQVVVSSAEQLQKLLNEQLVAGVLVVPVGSPPPAPNTQVEFFIRIDFGDSPRTVGGEGRIMQILDQGGKQQAVLEVQDAAKLRAELEG